MTEDENGKLILSDKPDMDKIQEFLSKAEKENFSVRDLRKAVKRYRRQPGHGCKTRPITLRRKKLVESAETRLKEYLKNKLRKRLRERLNLPEPSEKQSKTNIIEFPKK